MTGVGYSATGIAYADSQALRSCGPQMPHVAPKFCVGFAQETNSISHTWPMARLFNISSLPICEGLRSSIQSARHLIDEIGSD